MTIVMKPSLAFLFDTGSAEGGDSGVAKSVEDQWRY